MNTLQNLIKNTSLLFLAQIVNYILGFFYIMYSARYLGAEGFGIISFALAFSGVFSIFVDLGLSTLTVREISRNRNYAAKYFNNFLIFKVFLAFVTFLAVFILINLMNYDYQTIIVVYIITFSIIFNSFTQFFNSIFQAFEKMEYHSIATILNGILMFIGIIIAINQSSSLFGFAIVYLIVSILIFLLSFILLVRKFTTLNLVLVDRDFWKKSIKEAIPLSFYAVFLLIAFKVDIILLSLLKSNLEVGWYTASYRLIEALMFLPSVVSVSVFPIFSKLHISSKESLKLAYEKSFKILILLGIPISFGGTLLSQEIILLVYTSTFYQSIIALQILIWTIPLIFANYIFRTLLVSINKQNLLLKIILIIMVLNIFFNLILIPFLGFIGASLVTIFTELIAFILSFYYISRFVIKLPLLNILSKSIVASLLMSLFIEITDLNLFLTIICSIILYFGILIVFKTFTKDEHDLLKRIIN